MYLPWIHRHRSTYSFDQDRKCKVVGPGLGAEKIKEILPLKSLIAKEETRDGREEDCHCVMNPVTR